MSDSQNGKTVVVYVRLCNDDDDDQNCREMSFYIPEEMSQEKLLNAGFAIDGNSAAKAVTPYYNNAINEQIPLMDALREEQLSLVQWLCEHGYQVEFK